MGCRLFGFALDDQNHEWVEGRGVLGVGLRCEVGADAGLHALARAPTVLSYGELAQPARPRRGEARVGHFRSERMRRRNAGWYFYTREGSEEGPFAGADEAKAQLERYVSSVADVT